MNRRNAVQIRPNDDQYDNADLITLLYHMTSPVDIVFNEVPEIKKDSIFFIESSRMNKELFKHNGCFEWLNGSVGIWHNEKPVTRFNYRTAIPNENEEEEVIYTYLNWEDMTDVAPIQEDPLI